MFTTLLNPNADAADNLNTDSPRKGKTIVDLVTNIIADTAAWRMCSREAIKYKIKNRL